MRLAFTPSGSKLPSGAHKAACILSVSSSSSVSFAAGGVSWWSSVSVSSPSFSISVSISVPVSVAVWVAASTFSVRRWVAPIVRHLVKSSKSCQNKPSLRGQKQKTCKVVYYCFKIGVLLFSKQLSSSAKKHFWLLFTGATWNSHLCISWETHSIIRLVYQLLVCQVKNKK